jgi:hypothetical protein
VQTCYVLAFRPRVKRLFFGAEILNGVAVTGETSGCDFGTLLAVQRCYKSTSFQDISQPLESNVSLLRLRPLMMIAPCRSCVRANVRGIE